jgi:hypothetical protein
MDLKETEARNGFAGECQKQFNRPIDIAGIRHQAATSADELRRRIVRSGVR